MKAKVISPILGLSLFGAGLLPLLEWGQNSVQASEPDAKTIVGSVESVGAELDTDGQNVTQASDVFQVSDEPPLLAQADGEMPPESDMEMDSPDTVEEPVVEEPMVEEAPANAGELPPGPVFTPDTLPTAPTPPQETVTPTAPEPQVLVAEVVVEGVEDDALVNAVYEAIATRPGQTATRSQIQSDINAIYSTGYFNNVQAQPSDTPLGVRVTYFVSPNPVLRSVQLAGNQVLTEEKVDEIFADQYGKVLNLNDLQAGIEKINQYYQDSGFVLGQVLAGSERVDADGTVTLQVAEGEIEGIGVRFQNDEGEPVKGKTKEYIITREMRTQPGEILNRDKLQTDLQRIFGLGLFEDVQVALEPGQDPRKVVVNLNVQERKTGSFSAGAGFSSNSGLFGTGSYTQSNLFGRNYKVNAQAQVGTRDFLFDLGFTDPWIKGDPYRTSYTVNAFNRLTLPLVFDGGVFDDTTIDDVQDQFRFRSDSTSTQSLLDAETAAGGPLTAAERAEFNQIGFNIQNDGTFEPDGAGRLDAVDVLDNPPCGVLSNPGAPGQACDVRLEDFDTSDGVVTFDNLDTPRVNRLGGGVAFTRPLTKNPDKMARSWVASAGIRYERVSIRDSDLDLQPIDQLGKPLAFSGVKDAEALGIDINQPIPANRINELRNIGAQDDLFSVQLGIARDLRNDALSPTKGNLIRAGVEQTLPFGSGSIAFTRLRASYSHFLPVNLLKKEGPQALAFNVQGGTIVGDLPPYEAFNLGGSNSVRGYRDGDVGSGRSFLQATAEYRFPLINFLGGIGGVLFVDYGTVLGTDNNVPGIPSIIRGKPGDGLGFGGGVRVKTPIGPVRIDYAFNEQGDDRVHFGFGERF